MHITQSSTYLLNLEMNQYLLISFGFRYIAESFYQNATINFVDQFKINFTIIMDAYLCTNSEHVFRRVVHPTPLVSSLVVIVLRF